MRWKLLTPLNPKLTVSSWLGVLETPECERTGRSWPQTSQELSWRRAQKDLYPFSPLITPLPHLLCQRAECIRPFNKYLFPTTCQTKDT